jgi:hypothetical protein
MFKFAASECDPLGHLSTATIDRFLRPGNMPPAPNRPFNFAADGDDLQLFVADVPGAEDEKYPIAYCRLVAVNQVDRSG